MNKLTTKLLNIIRDAGSWVDIYAELKKCNNSKSGGAGKLFEEFCKYYYLEEPSVCNDYKHVWLFPEIPHKVKQKLNLGKIDHGIDLVLEDHDGCYTVVQCKFRNDQNGSISWSNDKLSNLFADGEKADNFIIFTNASGIDKHSASKKENRLKLITVGDLLNLTSNTIKAIKGRMTGLLNPVKIKKPKGYQEKAISEVVKGFKSHDRGQLILPCGAGKTLVSLWIKEALMVKRTIVLVPSLALLRQIKSEWSANLGRYIPYICVCSEKDIDGGNDHITASLYEISGNVTTNITEIGAYLKAHKEEVIVYSTYQSLEAIAKAIKSLKFTFDLAICDEAHKTSGSKLGTFGLINSDTNVSVKKRLYMTATPRIISEKVKNALGNEILDYLYDMSNRDVYGPEFYRMSFNEAIDRKILVDYQIVAIGVDDTELQRAILERKYISGAETIDEVANNYALEKFMQKFDANHAITFHSTIRRAKSFAERHQKLSNVDIFHVNGSQSTNDRTSIMNAFKNSPKSIMTNARCLTEGVDVPAIDIVYFCDPKNSKIDIVQASGRALRRDDKNGKKFGYIVVPIFHREMDKLDEMIDSSPFKNLIKIIKALSCHDERLVGEITRIKLSEGKRKVNLEHISIEDGCKLITLDGFEDELERSLFDQVISKTPIPFREFQLARQYVHTLNLRGDKDWKFYCKSGQKPMDIPSTPEGVYKDSGWISMGDWLGTGRIATRDMTFKSFEQARIMVQALKLRSGADWWKYCKSDEKPADIPSNPNIVYKDSGWQSWGDWLGTNTIAVRYMEFKSFEEARSFVHALKLKSQADWAAYRKGGKRPKDIPSNPDVVYKDTGWQSWGDWFGTGTIAAQNKITKSFNDARAFVHTLNLKSKVEWIAYCRSGQKPEDIPWSPESVYKGLGWISMGDWLGTGSIAPQNMIYKNFDEARAFVHTLNLKGQASWRKYCYSGQKPEDIPSNPNVVYKRAGWTTMGDWLGTGTVATRDRVYKPFKEARAFVHTLNLKSRADWRKYQKPADIPSTPERTYKDSGWVSMVDWLGMG